MQLDEIMKSYEEMKLEINYINERLVLLLNELEVNFDFSPFESEDKKLMEIWTMISGARNYNIYKKDKSERKSIDKG